MITRVNKLRKLKNKMIERIPKNLFEYFANLYYTVVFTKERVKIERYRNCWLITKGGISLLSPTPKFIGQCTLKTFEDKFERFFRIEEGDTVLDVGCGLYPHGDIGVDLKRNSKATVIADGRFLPFQDKVFDKTVSFQVLDEAKNPQEVLEEMKRVTRSTITLTVPNIQYFLRQVRHFLNRKVDISDGHIYCWSKVEMRHLCSRLKLGVVTFDYLTWKRHHSVKDGLIKKLCLMFLPKHLKHRSLVIKIEIQDRVERAKGESLGRR